MIRSHEQVQGRQSPRAAESGSASLAVPEIRKVSAEILVLLPQDGKGVALVTGEGVVKLEAVQLEGKRTGPATEFVRG